jgi:hypothetical protein
LFPNRAELFRTDHKNGLQPQESGGAASVSLWNHCNCFAPEGRTPLLSNGSRGVDVEAC